MIERSAIAPRLFAGLALVACAAACAGGGPVAPPAGAAASAPDAARKGKIAHVVIIVQENRSFDNLFDCFPGTDCVKTAPGPEPRPEPTTPGDPCPVLPTASPGPTPTPIRIKFNVKLLAPDIDHSYCAASLQDYDGGKMDGFYWNIAGYPGGLATRHAYEVVAERQIRPYWDMAQQYVLADRTFPTQASGSFTAHQDLIRGNTVIQKNESVIDYPWNKENASLWGCDDYPDSVTSLITSKKLYLYNQGPFPCFSYSTIRDLLDAQDVSWKYYVPAWPDNGGQEWNAFDAIYAVRHDKGEWPNKSKNYNCTGSCVSWPQKNVLCDIAGSTASPCPKPNPPGPVQLPAVSWVIPDGIDSDHGGGTEDDGPDWVATVVNAIGKSSYWNSTAIFILWDDWGGYYDHIPPPQLDYQGLGIRVPMIVLSPYAKKGYVDHTQYEFGSLLKFTEKTFGLPSLGTTDARANDIVAPFDFGQKPRNFVPIKPLDREHDRRYFLMQPPSGVPVDTQ